MSKVKTANGYLFVKELGGAIQHEKVSFAAQWLVDNHKVRGRVLDYGCGHGFDADHFGWEGFDPYYRQESPEGSYDTIICNHVLNMLTRRSRRAVLSAIQALLSDDGVAWLVVPRSIPKAGKLGARKRIQNYVSLELPSVHATEKMEIYRMTAAGSCADKTQEIETRLGGK